MGELCKLSIAEFPFPAVCICPKTFCCFQALGVQVNGEYRPNEYKVVFHISYHVQYTSVEIIRNQETSL